MKKINNIIYVKDLLNFMLKLKIYKIVKQNKLNMKNIFNVFKIEIKFNIN